MRAVIWMKRAHVGEKKMMIYINIRIILPNLSVVNVITPFYALLVVCVTEVGMGIC